MGNFIGFNTREGVFSNQTHPKQNHIVQDQKFTQLVQLVKEFEDKYNISDKDLMGIISEPSIQIPVSIYSCPELSALESSVKYLKENLGLKYSVIGKLLNRDERTIWTTYSNAQKKFSKKLDDSSLEKLPIQVISTREYSILESITGYLKDERELKYSEIARILARDQRTVWTCYNRLQKKRGDKK